MTLGMHHLLSGRRTKPASLKTREKDWQNSAASLVVFDIPGLYLDSSFICPHVQKLQSNLEVIPLNAGSKLIDPTSLSWCKLDSDARAPLTERPYLVCGRVCSTRTIGDLHVCFTETAQLVPRNHVQVAYHALKLCFFAAASPWLKCTRTCWGRLKERTSIAGYSSSWEGFGNLDDEMVSFDLLIFWYSTS